MRKNRKSSRKENRLKEFEKNKDGILSLLKGSIYVLNGTFYFIRRSFLLDPKTLAAEEAIMRRIKEPDWRREYGDPTKYKVMFTKGDSFNIIPLYRLLGSATETPPSDPHTVRTISADGILFDDPWCASFQSSGRFQKFKSWWDHPKIICNKNTPKQL